MGPLTGLKVIDLTHVMAGPTCTRMLADMGAKVIKIEKASSGDDTRHMIPPKIGEEAAAFLMMNRNKRGIVLDLKTEGGKKILWRLIATADVLVENFAPGVMERLGFGYEDLRKDYPSLIYCSLSGFGRTGPYKHRRGFDLVAQAMTGIMSFTGERPHGPPVKCGAAVGYNRGHPRGDGHLGRLCASTEDRAGPVGRDLAVRGRTGADLLAIVDRACDRDRSARDGLGASAQRSLSSF
jgi:crotonobetainyl-CoA:carnitine CoA-transferase CaiB-like acyl-CoA transferase